jgi:hypothetical protein
VVGDREVKKRGTGTGGREMVRVHGCSERTRLVPC